MATWTGWVIRGSEAYRKSGAIRRGRRAVNITYIHLAEEFVYLAVVMDAFSRKVIGWALADHLEASLAVEALDMALAARGSARGLIHHSDRGVQYACHEYRERLEAHGVKTSMSRAGNPYDNANAERFMRTLKEEEVNAKTYATIEEAGPT